MKEIAQNGDIDDLSLMHYIKNGINDTLHNKVILFECNTQAEFKQKLLIYEEVC